MHMLAISKLLILRHKLYRLQRAKKIAMQLSQHAVPYVSNIDRFYYWKAKYLYCGCIKTHFRINRDKPHIIKLFKLYIIMTTAGTYPNFILIAILGFVGGIILSYAYFFMCAVILDLSTWSAFYISAILCIFLTLGLAFFESVRCTVMSILPETCTSRARAMLISFALLLLLSGPGTNIIFNTRQLTQTVSCTQEQVLDLGRNLTELYKKPIRIVKNAILYLIRSIKPVVEKVKSILIYIKDGIRKTAKIIKDMFSWLRIFSIECHSDLGTPAEACTNNLENFVKDCQASLGFLKGICNPFNMVNIMCVPLKAITAVCVFKDFIKNDVFDFLKEKLKQLGDFIKSIFYVKVSFHHSYNFRTNQSKSLKDVFREVHKSQEERLKTFLGVIHFMKFVLAMYIAYVLLSAFMYRFRFFYQVRYDNHHINRFLIELDTKRASVNRQTLFPLTGTEKSNYVSLMTFRLSNTEWKHFLSGSTYLILTCLKTAFIFIIDVFLFFILDLVHNHGKVSFYFGRDKSIIGAEGSGFFYALYSVFNSIFNVFDIELRFDTGPCLPQPIPIDWLLYERIAVIMAYAWLMSLLQPFALRFRNYVMSYYYPAVARKRAVWLYNHILQTRGVFSQYVRRTLLTRGAIGLRSERIDPYRWIYARFPRMYFFMPFRNLFKECMVCGYIKPKIRCATPGCMGMYDKECFEQINNTCVLCNMPQDFKGMDVSEEEDSDGEMDTSSEPETPAPWWKFWVQVSRTDFTIPMEEGVLNADTPTPPPSPIFGHRSPPSVPDARPAKDYFSEEWRREDWASMDDYEIPDPDLGAWTRPHFTSTVAPSSGAV